MAQPGLKLARGTGVGESGALAGEELAKIQTQFGQLAAGLAPCEAKLLVALPAARIRASNCPETAMTGEALIKISYAQVGSTFGQDGCLWR